VIQVQDWAEIRHLYFAEEVSQRAIAERLGVARKTVVERDKSGHQVGASRSGMRSLTRLEHRERWLHSPGQGAKSAAVMPAG
jgi:IS30 family transposase